MYTEISHGETGDPIPFEEAFLQLKAAYELVDAEHQAKMHDRFTPGWHRSVQIQVTGRAEGVLYVEFEDGNMHIVPGEYEGADAYVAASFDQLLDMATGNLTKGAEIRDLLAK